MQKEKNVKVEARKIRIKTLTRNIEKQKERETMSTCQHL